MIGVKLPKNRDSAAKLYDRISRWYDLLSGPAEERFRSEALILLNLLEGENVLEIGSGTGSSLKQMSQDVGDSGRVFGLDLSTGMLRVARKRCIHTTGGLISLIQGDARCLPFDNRRIDAILMSFTLELFSDPEIPVVLEECRRVLKPGGRMCMLALSDRRPKSRLQRAYEWLHNRLPELIDCRPIRLGELLETNGFHIQASKSGDIFGLPVEIVLVS